jgi:hypothetical protein
MKKILSSASKVVFILMAVSSCVGFFMKLLDADKFMLLAGVAFTFYFSNKGETGNVPYAGK